MLHTMQFYSNAVKYIGRIIFSYIVCTFRWEESSKD